MNDVKWIENGIVYVNGNKSTDVASLAWNAHPKFKGVSLKTVLTGSESGGTLTVMLVKIEAHREIGEHIHAGKAELHETIAGEGEACIGGRRVVYHPGVVSLVPRDASHSVKAGADGLFLLAKFAPPLD